MKIIKCRKCGSPNLILKHIEVETKTNVFDTILFWTLGVVTLGLYFLFWHMNEKKATELGTEYYECKNCHHKMKASAVTVEDLPKQENPQVDEKELEEIREIGKAPLNMETWKSDREKAVQKKREEKEKKNNLQKKCKKS